MEEKTRTNRKTIIGEVVRLPKDKTMAVKVESKFRHPKYGKIVKEHKKYLVHIDREEDLALGTFVLIGEVKPISKRKTWEYIKKLDTSNI